MASHIDLARDICENALKIITIVLFINFYILAEHFLRHISFKNDKKCFLCHPFCRCYKEFFIIFNL
jgi:hypothetical protein